MKEKKKASFFLFFFPPQKKIAYLICILELCLLYYFTNFSIVVGGIYIYTHLLGRSDAGMLPSMTPYSYFNSNTSFRWYKYLYIFYVVGDINICLVDDETKKKKKSQVKWTVVILTMKGPFENSLFSLNWKSCTESTVEKS